MQVSVKWRGVASERLAQRFVVDSWLLGRARPSVRSWQWISPASNLLPAGPEPVKCLNSAAETRSPLLCGFPPINTCDKVKTDGNCNQSTLSFVGRSARHCPGILKQILGAGMLGSRGWTMRREALHSPQHPQTLLSCRGPIISPPGSNLDRSIFGEVRFSHPLRWTGSPDRQQG